MIFLLQIAAILAVARVTRRAFALLKQPSVVAEMVAGFLLGPSFFGWIAPGWSAALFPASSLESLNALSQIGLVLFMFLVGLRVRPHASVTKRAAAVVSAVSILVPFVFGAILGSSVHTRLAPAGVDVLPFALFIGAAMSITAFPVLARILADHHLLATDVGLMAITCAAFDDVSGWLILGGILTLVNGGAANSVVTQLGGFFVYLAVMFLVVRPGLARLAVRWSAAPATDGLALALLVPLLSAVATDALGVHALFGAFVAGVIMPRAVDFEAWFANAVEPLTMTLLLPLFFAFTGLRTSVRLISSPSLVLDLALVLIVAVVGKGGASALAARAAGFQWRESAALGVLLNTRGLVELVILNIGLDAGILSPVMFSMMVVMTLLTTVMTSPILRLLGELKLR